MVRPLSDKLNKPASDLVFGVMQFGGKADARASRAMFDQARAAGINQFDAAYIYTEGNAETLLGEFAAAERDDLVLISKSVYRPEMRRADIEDQVATSLRRLRTTHVDVMYMHRYPGDAYLDETLETLRDLHKAGAFALLGASNFAAWQVMKAQARAAELGAPRIELLQPMYNLVKRQAEVELLPMAEDQGLTVHSYSPLGGGLLTGKYTGGDGQGRIATDATYNKRYAPDWMHAAAGDLASLAADLGHPPEALAVAWVAEHSGITSPIISASAPEQLPASLASAAVDMTPALYAQLSALTPAPPPATDRLEEA